jgi:type VI secretion system protein ImpG
MRPMSDEFLPYYSRELTFLRHMGQEFAEKHPKIAGRLHLNAEGSHDPHVQRILEGFAYLNARIQYKLDDDFPEIIDSLLGVLYPHYQRPIPSMAIVQFQLDRSQATRVTGMTIDRGAFLESEPVDGERCRFQTCYPATAWPFQLEAATLMARPFQAPVTPKSSQAEAVLRLELQTFDPKMAFSQIAIGALRFYLHMSQAHNAFSLYELLFNSTIEIVVAGSPRDPEPIVLPKSSLLPVGFERDEGMIPYSARSFPGYRLLTEYFAFPEKFRFCELTGLTPARLSRLGNRMEIYVFLNKTSKELERAVSKDNFRLGCAPIVNLFPQRADPFPLTHRQTEYRIIPDARRISSLEVYSVDRVEATSPRGELQEYVPFYSLKHGVARETQQTFWHSTRRASSKAQSGVADDKGTEVFLSLVDLGFRPSAPADWTVDIETMCLNRDLPRRLSFGGGRPRFELVDGKGGVSSITCLTKPTPTRRPPLGQGLRWRLLSHLSLNHLSLSQEGDGAEALREILKLYDVLDDSETRKLIEGILRVQSRRTVGRCAGAMNGLCQGIEVSVHFDEEKFSGSGVYLFAAVLDRFLGMYSSVNSFSRLVATSEQRQNQGEAWKWPARVGEKVLL